MRHQRDVTTGSGHRKATAPSAGCGQQAAGIKKRPRHQRRRGCWLDPKMMSGKNSILTIWAVTVAISALNASKLQCCGAYIPGFAPKMFKEDELVKLKVNAMTSQTTLYPIDYYSAPFCQPLKKKMDHENLGEFLSGDRIMNSPYVLNVLKSGYCEQTCIVDFDKSDNKAKITNFIKRGYYINWLVDNLPPIVYIEKDATNQVVGSRGFPIGYGDDKNGYIIYNHANILIDYHEVEGEDKNPSPRGGGAPLPHATVRTFRIVRFSIALLSIKHNFEHSPASNGPPAIIIDPIPSCEPGKIGRPYTDYSMAKSVGPQPISGEVLFTYDVHWKKSPISYSYRWDVYLYQSEYGSSGVHWGSITSSLIVIFFLFFTIATILVKSLKKDFQKYNSVRTDEEIEELKEENGWKLVHADVFRPPKGAFWLAVIVGTGVQLLLMSGLTIISSLVGFASPNHRGVLILALLFNYQLMGLAAGFVSARLYKTFKGKSWQKCTAATALGFPCIFFTLFFIMNITAALYGSTDSVPFTKILLLLFFWLCVSTPLVFIGAYFGYRKNVIEFPIKSSSIPKQIEDQMWYASMPFTFLVAGLLPFFSCFVELYFIFLSVWANYYYHFFYMLFFSWITLIIASAEISIIHTYIQLCTENHRWWWNSFLIGGSTSFWFFLHSIYYFFTLRINIFATYILYFGYVFLSTLSIFLFTGAAGFFGSLWFNKKIYGSIKVD